MSLKYSIDGQDTNTAATTLLELRSTAAIRPEIYDMICGSDATPADNAAEYVLQRNTTVGAATGVTPRALDPDDPSATATAGEAHTSEPTYTANVILLQWAQNQRATFRWVAAPSGALKLPAADNGVGLQVITVAGAAVNTNAMMHFEE